MGTKANPSAKQNGNTRSPSFLEEGVTGGKVGGDIASSEQKASTGMAGTSVSSQALKRDPGLAVDWNKEEQVTLEKILSNKGGSLDPMKYVTDPPVVHYAKIAKHLSDKTVRDVALRCRWMSKKESGKPFIRDFYGKTMGSNLLDLVSSPLVNKFSRNRNRKKKVERERKMAAHQGEIIKRMNDIITVTQQMPPLPVMLNEELANTILPSTILPRSPLLPPQ